MTRSSQAPRLERRSNPVIVPGLIALGLIGVAITVAVLAREPERATPPDPPKPKPFADMPPEVPAVPPEPQPRTGKPLAPAGIASEPLWVQARALAAEGLPLFEAAVAASARGDLPATREKGGAARAKYDKALELTAEWEENVLGKFDEHDERVVAIQQERTDWLHKLQWLDKVVGP